MRRPGSEAPPAYTRVAIIGVGLIGASIAMSVRRRWPSSLIIGVDSKDVLERAMVAHLIDVGADDLGMTSEADLVVLAAPVRTNATLVERELSAFISRPAMVTDVGGTKRAIAAAARGLPSNLTFIGGHPIAGAAAGGLEHARADLFENRPWILCPEGGQDAAPLKAFITELGARCVEMTPDAHDRLVAYLSHLPQLAASALMHVVGEGAGEPGLALAGRGLKDTTRLAGSPPGVWKDVCATNADNLGDALGDLIRVLEELRNDLAGGDAVERLFDSARQWKSRLDR